MLSDKLSHSLTPAELRMLRRFVALAWQFERERLDTGLSRASFVLSANYCVFHRLVARGIFGKLTLDELARMLGVLDDTREEILAA